MLYNCKHSPLNVVCQRVLTTHNMPVTFWGGVESCDALLCAGVASPPALCAVLGTTVQKGKETVGECPEEGDEDGEGPGGEDLGAAEVTGPVQPGEEEAEGRPHHSLQLPREGE